MKPDQITSILCHSSFGCSENHYQQRSGQEIFKSQLTSIFEMTARIFLQTETIRFWFARECAPCESMHGAASRWIVVLYNLYELRLLIFPIMTSLDIINSWPFRIVVRLSSINFIIVAHTAGHNKFCRPRWRNKYLSPRFQIHVSMFRLDEVQNPQPRREKLIWCHIHPPARGRHMILDIWIQSWKVAKWGRTSAQASHQIPQHVNIYSLSETARSS